MPTNARDVSQIELRMNLMPTKYDVTTIVYDEPQTPAHIVEDEPVRESEFFDRELWDRVKLVREEEEAKRLRARLTGN